VSLMLVAVAIVDVGTAQVVQAATVVVVAASIFHC